MATPESAVKNSVKKLLTEYGVYYFMPFGGGYGRAGVADLVCSFRGRFIAIECKAGNGKTTALQERELQRVRDSGGHALVVSDKESTMEELRWLLERIRNNEL